MKTNIDNIFHNTPYETGVELSLNELLCYQQHSKIKLHVSNGCTSRHLSGQYLSKIKGRGMEFSEVRHYQAGDDVRTIDWSVTARTGKAHTKLFHEEKERPVFILLDLTDSMIFGSKFVFKSVQAAHLASLLCFQANGRNDRVGGIVFNQSKTSEFKPSGRTKEIMRFLNKCQNLCINKALKNSEPQTLLRQLKRLSRLVQTGCQIHLISDFSQLSEESTKLISQMRKHQQITAWQISDPIEQVISTKNLNNKIQINSLNGSGFLDKRKCVKEYNQAASKRQGEIEQTFIKLAIPLYQISAALPLLEQFNVSSK